MPILQVNVKEETLERIGAFATNQGRDTDGIVDEALTKYLQWHETQMQLWKETEEAIAEAERGETIEAKNVFSWLDTWGEVERKAG